MKRATVRESLSPELQSWMDKVIVPILVEEYLALLVSRRNDRAVLPAQVDGLSEFRADSVGGSNRVSKL